MGHVVYFVRGGRSRGGPMSRCWEANVGAAEAAHGVDSREYAEALDRPSTCLLPGGHPGPHRWTFDGDVRFVLPEARGR